MLSLPILKTINFNSKIKLENYKKLDSGIDNIGSDSYDPKGLTFGVKVDTNLWDIRWNYNYESIKTNDGNQILGYSDIHIGEAFYKKKIDGQYWTSMLVAIKTRPYIGEYNYSFWELFRGEVRDTAKGYGWLNSIKLKTTINEVSAKMLDSYPKYQAKSNTYSIGGSFGASKEGPSLGIDASVSYEVDAINITNNTRTENRVFEISLVSSGSGSAQKFMEQENWFYFRYDCLTDYRYLHQSVNIELNYVGYGMENARFWSADRQNKSSTTSWALNFV